MKKTFYYLLTTSLLCISSMHGADASSSTESLTSAENLNVDERMRNAVSALHADVQTEALQQANRLYATQPTKIELILSMLGDFKSITDNIQPLVILGIKCIDSASHMEDVVNSWIQVDGIENAELRTHAIACMAKAASSEDTEYLEDIKNIGNAWDTLGKIENLVLQKVALKKMLAASSTQKMGDIAERARKIEKQRAAERATRRAKRKMDDIAEVAQKK